MVECPSHQELSDFDVGRLSDERAEWVAAHLDDCQPCAKWHEQLDSRADALMHHLRNPISADVDICEDSEDSAALAARVLAAIRSDADEEGTGRNAQDTRIDAPLPRDASASESESFGDYQLLEEIARGGMGVVYKARQRSLNRVVAVKMILAGGRASESQIKRFRIEAEAAAALDHPGIVPVYEVGEHEGVPFFSMGYVEGPSLAALLKEGPLAPQHAADLVRQLANALQFAHDEGVIHRDLKPSNVLLAAPPTTRAANGGAAADGLSSASARLRSDYTPRIADFGLAKLSESEVDLTMSGQVMGTPSYMPPEQAAGQIHRVGPLSDVYSLGAVLYHMMTGRPPFQADNVVETLRQATSLEPVPPRQLNPAVPVNLETICLKCLEKDTGRRYASSWELSQEIGRFQAGLPIRARPISWAARSWRWCRRNPVVAALVLVTVVSLSLGAISSTVQWRRADSANRILRTELRKTQAFRLAAESEMCREQFPQRSVLLAAKAVHATLDHGQTVDVRVEQSLRDSLHAIDGIGLSGHGEAVTGAAFGPDGRLVTVGTDGSLRLWNPDSEDPGVASSVMNGHAGGIHALAIDHRANRAITGGVDGAVRVWDLGQDPPREEFVLDGSAEPVAMLSMSANGTNLLASGHSRPPRIWDLAASNPAARPLSLPEDTNTFGLLMAPDGTRAIASHSDDTLRIFHVDSSHTLDAPAVLRCAEGLLGPMLLSGSGQMLVTAGVDAIRVWDLGSADPHGTSRKLSAAKSVFDLALSPDDRWLAATGGGPTVDIWDLQAADASPRHRLLHAQGDSVQAIAFWSEGRVITGGGDGTVRIWDLSADDPMLAPIVWRGHEEIISDLVVSENGRWACTVGGPTAHLWDLHTPQPSGAATVFAVDVIEIHPLAMNHDGTRMVTAANATAYVWDLRSTDPRAHAMVCTGHSDSIHAAVFSPDGSWLATAGADRIVRVWCVDGTNRPGIVLEGHVADVHSLAWSRDGQQLASGSADRTARVWRPFGAEPASGIVLEGHQGPIWALAFRPNGKQLATGSADTSARVWNLEAGVTDRRICVLADHLSDVGAVTFSQDGQQLTTLDQHREVRRWDLRAASPKAVSVPLGENEGMMSASTFAGDRRLVTAGMDYREQNAWNVHVWDLTTDDRPAKDVVLRGHHGQILGTALSGDGRWLASGAADGTIRIWSLELPDLLGAARRAAGRRLTPQELVTHGLPPE